MESVACEAGVARATVYRRYRDKADLITAAIAGNSTSHRSIEPPTIPEATWSPTSRSSTSGSPRAASRWWGR